VLPLVFFSFSQSKLPGYILPSLPPCAMLTASYLLRRRAERLNALVVALHAILLGVLTGFILAFPTHFIRHLPFSPNYRLVIASSALVVFAVVYLALRYAGTPMLRAVTLVPVIFIVAFILRVGAPSIDNYYSARPVAGELAGRHIFVEGKPIAAVHVRRELRYGLSFYQNRKIEDYDENQVPPGAHFLVAKAGSLSALSFKLRDRQLVRVGGFSPQDLDYFLVSATSAGLLGRPDHANTVPAQSGLLTK
jgi:hypothetical protein